MLRGRVIFFFDDKLMMLPKNINVNVSAFYFDAGNMKPWNEQASFSR